MINKESQSSDHLTASSRRGVMMTKVAVALAASFLLASIAVIIAIAVIQTHKRTYISPGLKYGIVLDAGSSRTTVYLYQWPAEKENNTGVVSQTTKCQVEGPGISDLHINEAQDKKTWTSLESCMAVITKTIPTNQHNSTPVFLGATAGMRLLHLKNEEMSNTILKDMQRYLSSLPFNFHNASIISGQEEGLYGWITVNYLMGNFLEKDLWNAWVHPHGARTVGSLDLGGASTQIAFAVTDDVRGEDIIKVSLYGYEYNIYTHSFLCYGKNEAEKRVLAKLSKAYAGFYWTASALNVKGSKSMETFNHNMKIFCSKDWKTLKQTLDIKENHLKSYCYSANYVHTILADGYKFNTDNWKNLNFQKEVNKTSIAWSLGYMLAQSNMIPAEGKILKLPINNVLFTGLLLMFSALTIITLTYLVIALARFLY
ncbi:ectonucleoside triphosphate diphosphohydrolase 3-like isoform X2 [Myxocyprinus asiaticus]|uniref:ectonucleoside triphosphate diphosphohydrolase 3-like isoform X2 n=1 Tax=Myxocyprinus asiaticus TaxID=70543 RepID=UPI002221B5A0|nr:ectonucleoside triphosphate diphosphohydrolase 3-like isoform X2 [Myxocyprinus asiaticus]